MQISNSELTTDWTKFARASLQTRMDDAGHSTTKVLTAVQNIAAELNDEQNLEPLLQLKAEEATPTVILDMLRDLLAHIDSQSALAKLIAPLFSALQFEDRTRQKLESILGMLNVWNEVREQDISDEDLADRLMENVIAMEQQDILRKYFPEHIKSEAPVVDDGIDLF